MGLKLLNLWCFLSVKLFRSKIFRGHGHSLLNRTSTLRQYNKTKQYIGGLSLAFIGIFGHFIQFYLYHYLKIRVLGLDFLEVKSWAWN